MADEVIVGGVWESFQKASKDEVLKVCKESLVNYKFDHVSLKEKDFRIVFYNTIWLIVDGKLKEEEILSPLSHVLEQKPEGLSVLGDLLCAVDAETSSFEDKERRERFLSLLSSLASILPDSLLKERLEPETLQQAGVIQSQKNFNQKLIRTKTKLFYKQQKFNLLREENEGYAKLITELGQEFTSQFTPRQMLDCIKSLIGFFNLDPNRVLDAILELFECRLEQSKFFIDLLTQYLGHCDITGLCDIIGFKFQFYHDTPDTKTPIELYKVAAMLLKNEVLHLDDIYPHLMPKDAEIAEMNKRKILLAKEDAKKLNVVLLTENENSEEKDGKEQREEMEIDNQKAGLCLALLEIGAWEQSSGIMDRLPNFSLLDEQNIVKSLCYVIHSTIEPLYRRYSPKAALGKIYQEIGECQRCVQFTDLPVTIFPMFFHLGAHLHADPVLMIKVIRICKAFMKEFNQVSEILKGKYLPVWSGILTLLDEVLLPSLSLMECNCAVAEEVWGLLKYFPYEVRYRLYGQWKNSSYNSHPLLIMAKAKTLKKARYITKRLTKENIKPFGRQIGKASHSNPGILFEHILNQIQRYDNFIGPMVDALKYLTPLAYDILSFCVIEALANPDRERMKQSDTNISDWLQSLALFCGTVFKKYAIELTGLLQYVANQLKAGKSLDLLVLKEVVQKMSGIELTEEVTQTQLEALCGGDLLKAEGGYFGQVRNTKKSSQRLRDALIEGKLTIPLCLLIAQQRNGIVFVEDTTRHLKLVGKIFDQCQDTLVQFGGFLATQLNTDDYEANLPSLDELRRIYHITPDAAFCLSRPLYRHAIQLQVDAFKKNEGQDRSKTVKQRQEALEKNFCEVSDDVYRPVIESAIPLHPAKIWNNLSPQLYTVFWSMAMYDLYVPLERYDAEIHKLKLAIDSIDDNKELTSLTKKKKEKERCQLLIDKLREEQHVQQEHNRCVKKWLETKKEGWFPSKTAKGETITQFLQICIFPRCVFTANDAVYCAKFIHIIHTLQTPNFSTLICFDRVFSDISYIVASLTENEASRYGRFLCAMLEMVMRWHHDKRLYEQECSKFPGFLTVLRATNNEKADYLDYENFRHVCHKWQYKLTKAVVVCLESKDYMQIRNTIMILTKILPHYPKVQNLGQALERRIEKIIEEEKEKRQDLFTLATGYLGLLKLRKSSMVPENKFHIKEEKEKPSSEHRAKSAGQQEKSDRQPAQGATRAAQATSKDHQSEETSSKQPAAGKEVDHSSDRRSLGKETNIKSEKSTSRQETSAKERESSKSRSEDEVKYVKSVKKAASSPSRHEKGRDSESEKSDRSQRSRSAAGKSSKTQDERNHEKSRSRSREKEREKEKDREREKEKEREKDREKEKEKEKEREKHKEPDKEREKTPREKDRSSLESSKERASRKSRPHSPLQDDPKKRKIDDAKFVSPSTKEGTPGSRSDDGKKDKKDKDREREKDKEKDRKNERKRTSLEVSGETKDAKRRKEGDTPERSSKKAEPPRKDKEKERDREKDGKVKLKDRSSDKEHDKSSKKDKSSPDRSKHSSKEKDGKEDESRSRKHRSSKPTSKDK